MKMFFAKDIQFGIRHHLSVEDFCNKYDCTEPEFLRRLQRLYSHNCEDIVKQINSSAAKAKAKPKNESKQTIEPDVPNVTSETTEQAIPEEQEIPEVQEKIDDAESFVREYLEELKTSETKLRDEIFGLEVLHKEKEQIHFAHIREYRTEKEIIDKLTAELREHNDYVERLYKEDLDVTNIMNEISASRRVKKRDLDNLLLEIAELERAKLFVETDGTIRPMIGSSVEIDETGAEELATALFSDQRFEDYRAGAIKQAARVICVAKNLNCQVDIEFADDEVGIIYLEYTEAI